jgi:hypothetical protein
MFGNLNRTVPVAEAKRKAPGLRLRAAAHRQAANRMILSAAVGRELPVFGHLADVLVRLEPSTLAQFIPVLGGLPDRPYRVAERVLDQVPGDVQQVLAEGCFLLERMSFERWLFNHRRRRLWPSQRAARTGRKGRPRSTRNALRDQIAGLVEERAWSGKDGIAALRRALVSWRGMEASKDTLARAVGELHLETGDPRFRLPKRRPRSG